MKYAIIGAGGTGGCLGFFLKKAGKDVTLIARGKHLEAIRKNGLTIQKLWDFYGTCSAGRNRSNVCSTRT